MKLSITSQSKRIVVKFERKSQASSNLDLSVTRKVTIVDRILIEMHIYYSCRFSSQLWLLVKYWREKKFYIIVLCRAMNTKNGILVMILTKPKSQKSFLSCLFYDGSWSSMGYVLPRGIVCGVVGRRFMTFKVSLCLNKRGGRRILKNEGQGGANLFGNLNIF